MLVYIHIFQLRFNAFFPEMLMCMCCMCQIMRLRDTNQEEVDDDIFSLACGPDFRVKKYTSRIVNGVRFNTVDRDKNKKTQNSGVMTEGTHNGQFIDFFGTLREIIQLEYNSAERIVVLFKCDWFKLDGKRTELQYDGFFKSINVGSLWYKDDSLILATQARKVFYLADTKLGKNWQVVQTYDHRHLYNVKETESAQYNVAAYQEDECCDEDGRRESVIDMAYDIPLNRNDEQGPIFEAGEIAQWVQESHKGGNHTDAEEEEDDTIFEYCSDDEGGATIDVDSDDE